MNPPGLKEQVKGEVKVEVKDEVKVEVKDEGKDLPSIKSKKAWRQLFFNSVTV